MKKLMVLTAVMILATAALAQAAGTKGGLGFRSLDGISAPVYNSSFTNSFTTTPALGVRQWFSEKLAVDFGLGFSSLKTEGGPPTVTGDEDSGIAIDIGVPFVAKSMDKVNFIIRPGILYGSATTKDKTSTTVPNEYKATLMTMSVQLEVEYMLTDNLSISAAHGISSSSYKQTDNAAIKNEEKISGFSTTGTGFTQLGFHVYLW